MIEEQKFLAKVREVLPGTGLELVGVKIADNKKKQVVTLIFEGDGTLEGYQQMQLADFPAEKPAGKPYAVDAQGVVEVEPNGNGAEGPAGLGSEAVFNSEDLPAVEPAKPRGRGGRPKGSKNKKPGEAQTRSLKPGSAIEGAAAVSALVATVLEGDESVEGIDHMTLLKGDDVDGDEE